MFLCIFYFYHTFFLQSDPEVNRGRPANDLSGTLIFYKDYHQKRKDVCQVFALLNITKGIIDSQKYFDKCYNLSTRSVL